MFDVVKSGYAITHAGDIHYAYAVAVVRNTSSTKAAGMTVTFAAYDAAGTVLGSEDTSAPIARAGQTVATGAPIEIKSGKVDHIRVQVAPLMPQVDPHPDSNFTARGIAYRPGGFDNTVTGEVESHYQQDVTQVYAFAVCYNASDQIVGGGEDYIDAINSGGTAPFSIDVSVTGKVDHCKVFPSLSGASEGH